MTELTEGQRQRELDRYRVVDSLPDEAYDDIVRLAASVCGAPTALISMIDRGRQWFKARSGMERTQTPRDEAFCDHAIRTPDQLFEVHNATLDARFAENPLVLGGPQIRFYAGMPLVTPSGAAIGTVCVLDQVPRSLDDDQRAALQALARLTMNLMESRHRERELERATQLADPPAAAAAAALGSLNHCMVAIFEVQDVAGAFARMGERGFERVLQALHETLEQALRPGFGDSVSRVSGCAELIVVLHGPNEDAALRALQDAVETFAHKAALRVLSAASESELPDEKLERIFLRADAALTQVKNGG